MTGEPTTLHAVIIPAYNPSLVLIEILQSLAMKDVAAIVLIDDGSAPEYSDLFARAAALPQVRLLRHEINRGKGAALKTGIRFALEHFRSLAGIVTADADGQHDPDDILRIIASLRCNEGTLVMGARTFVHGVPLRSLAGNVLTRHIANVLLGRKLADTQTGLRGIPAGMLPRLLELRSNRYEFELEMLFLAHSLQVPILEEPIRTIYENGNQCSHFRPLVDSLKICIVLLRFSAVSLLQWMPRRKRAAPWDAQANRLRADDALVSSSPVLAKTAGAPQRLGLPSPLASPHPARRTAIVTIIAKNCLAQARVLMKSVRDANPGAARVVLVIDDPEGYFDASKEDFTVVASHQLGIVNPEWFHFKYSILELSTAVKPFFLNWLFRNCGFEKVIYLDPDIRVYSSLAGIEAALETFNIVLTPHLTDPLEDDRQPTELQILRAGAYNLGFIALRANPAVERFLRWWQSHLYDHCAVDLLRGLFVDQRWIDLVPGMFSGVHILREPGYNAAYWNAAQRRIVRLKEQLAVGNQPLYFFHFSGYDPNCAERFSKHQDRLQLTDREDLRNLCEQYRHELFEHGYAGCSRWPYTYGRFRNGCLIPDVARHLLDEAPELLQEIGDPFSDAGYERIVRFWNAPVSASSKERPGITKLAYRVYRLRADVQAAMPDIFGADYIRFVRWMLSQAPHQHLLSEPLLGNVRAAYESSPKTHGGQWSAVREDFSLERTDPAEESNGPPLQLLTMREKIAAPRATRPPEEEDRSTHFTLLARHIYESRPDLQRVFPDPQGRDKAAYLAWLLYYGRETYALDDEYLTPLRASLRLIRADLKLAGRARLSLYCKVLQVARKLRPFIVRARGNNVLRGRFRARLGAAPLPAREKGAALEPSGVNVYGYFRAETGVGQSARNAVSALAAAGITAALQNLPAEHHSELDASITSFSPDAPYETSIFFVNPDQTELVRGGARCSQKKHNIGVWTWDLDEFPRQWDRAFEAYDEIWVPSSFCQAAIAARSPVPVVRIPYCVKPAKGSHYARPDFGIDPDQFVFLSVFDMRSGFGRKNPLAAMHAFQEAFAGQRDCQLIVKVNHANSNPAALRRLRAEASRHGVRVIEDTFRHGEVEALIRCADCIVSLHRSEGFGLVLAEAMLLEKPVIATGYSGNLDFTTPSTAFLVSYELQRVGPENPPYPEHSVWANPRIDDAVNQMRIVYENEFLRAQRARAGRALIEAKFSSEAVGAAMEARLQLVQRRGTKSRPGNVRTVAAGQS